MGRPKGRARLFGLTEVYAVTLVQKGVPSRAEVTDAAMSEQAECVMLNKGPHLLEAVTLLDNLLHRMEKHQWKKVPMLQALHAWDPGAS